MSYCIAWKKNEQVFMLSESAISSFEDDIQAGISTFGEVQGLYGKYYVQEGLLKIIKINDDFVLGVSGDVPTIIELLTHVYSLREMLTLEILRNIITNNYQDRGISAIVVEKGRHPQIYLFEENRFSCTDRCEIGAGRKNAFFCILFFTDSRKSLHESINEAKTTGRTIPPSNPLSRILWLSVHVLPPYGMKYA